MLERGLNDNRLNQYNRMKQKKWNINICIVYSPRLSAVTEDTSIMSSRTCVVSECWPLADRVRLPANAATPHHCLLLMLLLFLLQPLQHLLHLLQVSIVSCRQFFNPRLPCVLSVACGLACGLPCATSSWQPARWLYQTPLWISLIPAPSVLPCWLAHYGAERTWSAKHGLTQASAACS